MILKAFRALDTDRSGTIDYTEFSSVLKPWFEMTEVAAFSPVVHPPWVRSLLSPGKSAGLNPGMPVCLRRRTTAWIFSPNLTMMKAAKSHTTNSQRLAFHLPSNLAKISSGEQSLLGSLECFSLPDVLLCVPC